MTFKPNQGKISTCFIQAVVLMLCLILLDGMISRPENLFCGESTTELVDGEGCEEEAEEKDSTFDLVNLLEFESVVDKDAILESFLKTNLRSSNPVKDVSPPPELS